MNFDRAFDRLIGHEGGYVNHPKDPGGETNWGISKRSYPHLDIRALTKEDAKDIYKRNFWDKIHGDKMYGSVAFQMFDIAVNSGIGTAIRLLQRAVETKVDGIWGPKSQAALNALTEGQQLMLLNAERLDFYTSLNTWRSFGRGWTRRVAHNLRHAAADCMVTE